LFYLIALYSLPIADECAAWTTIDALLTPIDGRCGKNEETAEELIRYHNEDWTELSDKRKKALNDKQEPLIFIETIEGKQASGEYLEEVVLPGLKEFLAEEKAIELEDEIGKKIASITH